MEVVPMKIEKENEMDMDTFNDEEESTSEQDVAEIKMNLQNAMKKPHIHRQFHQVNQYYDD